MSEIKLQEGEGREREREREIILGRRRINN
jgi:hypothetical protein